MKKIILSALMLTFALVAGAQETPEIVATINGEVITKADFDRMWDALPPDMRKSYELAGGKIQFLDNYIRKRLVIQEAIKENFDSREDVEFIVDQAAESALFDAYVRMVISQDVFGDQELREIYESRKEEFVRPKRVKARHIVASPDSKAVNNRANSNATSKPEAKEKMTNIRRQLETSPESFVDLAMQFSEDGAAMAGGDLGWFRQGKMVKEFDDVVFSMEPGEISPVIETRYGYHVVKVEEIEPEQLIPFEKAKETLRNELMQKRTEEVLARVQQLTQELRNASNISVNRENL